MQKALLKRRLARIILPLKLPKRKTFAIKQPAIKELFRLFVFSILLLIHFNISAQVDPAKVDSLARWIDSAAHAHKAQQDSFIQNQNSTYRLDVNESLQQNSSNTNNLLAEQKKKEEKERQQALIRILSGVLILAIAIIALVRKRKTKS